MKKFFNKLFEKPFFQSRIKKDKVGILELGFGYFIGPFGCLLSSGIFVSLLNQYWTEVLFVEILDNPTVNLYLTLMPIISSIFIVLGNILMGQVIEKTKCKAGKARPWILFSSISLTITCLLMFAAPIFMKNEIKPIPTMILTALSYNLYYALAYPLYQTANSTLVPLSTRDSKSRTLLGSASSMAVTASVGAGSMIFPLLVGFVIASDSAAPAEKRIAWFTMMLIVAVVTFVLGIVQFLFTRERVCEETNECCEDTKKSSLTIKEQLNGVKKEKYWWIVLLLVLIFQFAGQIKNSALVFYTKKVVDTSANWGATMSLLSVAGTVGFVLAMIFTIPLANKISKRWTVFIGFIIGLIGDLVTYLFASNLIITFVGVFLKNLGAAPISYLILAMISDTLDHCEAKAKYRCDGLTMSLYSAIMVSSSPLSVGIVNLLSKNGTDANGCVVSFILIEAISFVICGVLLLFYSVEKHLKDDQKIIADRLEKEKNASQF